MDRLGYALSTFFNAETTPGSNAETQNFSHQTLVEACSYTKQVLTDPEFRSNLKIGDEYPMEAIGNDPFSQSLTNAITDVGPNQNVWMGTRIYGAGDFGILISREGNGYGVTASVAETNAIGKGDLAVVNKRVRSIAEPGLAALTIEASSV